MYNLRNHIQSRIVNGVFSEYIYTWNASVQTLLTNNEIDIPTIIFIGGIRALALECFHSIKN